MSGCMRSPIRFGLKLHLIYRLIWHYVTSLRYQMLLSINTDILNPSPEFYVSAYKIQAHLLVRFISKFFFLIGDFK